MTTTGQCACGCGERTRLAAKTDRSSGCVKGEPMRYLHGHNRRKNLPPVETPGPLRTPCLIARKNITDTGYAKVYIGGRLVLAHRIAYEQAKGPIPAGLHIDHLCRNRACLNPDHLEPVTPAENTRRGNVAKITAADAAAIRERAAAGEAPKHLAAAFGIACETVYGIVHRRRWVAP